MIRNILYNVLAHLWVFWADSCALDILVAFLVVQGCDYLSFVKTMKNIDLQVCRSRHGQRCGYGLVSPIGLASPKRLHHRAAE
jgi:hypothetical protein